MHWFGKNTIKRKATLISLLSSSAALLVASTMLFAFQWINSRSNAINDLLTQARIVAANSTAAVAFQDKKATDEILQALSAKPEIITASIYLNDGSCFTRYGRVGEPNALPDALPAKYHFEGKHLILLQPITENHRRQGTLYLRFDFRAVQLAMVRPYAMAVGVVLVVSLLLSIGLSAYLQRVISEPILGLANAAKSVADKRDYSVRVEKRSNDEIGLLIDAFNDMLSQIEARTKALQESEERFRALTESANDAIVSMDHSGKIISWNKGAERLFLYGEEESLGQSILRLMPERHHALHLSLLEKLSGGQRTQADERPLEMGGFRKDGTEFPFELSLATWTTAQGRFYTGIIRDITERKRAQAEMDNLHRQLVDSSRRAGMAEVATGVIHNVGNVLNSANVSTTLAAEMIQKSEVTKLAKVAAMLRERSEDLASFLANDPKGKRIPGYLIDLADHLGEEHAALSHELESLRKSIDHVKEIVAMQQSYASVAGVMEKVRVDELVEDALRMNSAAFERHQVLVNREFAVLQPILVDKHKVLQILINLIRNAKYALDERGQADRQLTIRVGQNGNECVKIQVADNGVGIPSENLIRIFSHGFSTRRDGHGFGLHSGALAAKEMGGTLVAASPGPGLGATFTLELPQQPASTNV